MKQDEIAYLLDNLPNEPPCGVVAEVAEEAAEELGEERMVYRMGYEMIPAPPEYLTENRLFRRERVAHCQCTACGGEFVTIAAPWKMSFYMWDDECGESWPLTYAENAPADGTVTPYTSGDGLVCPKCGVSCRVTHVRELRGGKVWRVQVATMQNIGPYTAVITWLVERRVSPPDYMSQFDAKPRHAWVIGRDRRLKAFSHREPAYMGTDVPSARWRAVRNSTDRFDALYNSADAFNNRRRGTYMSTVIPPEREMCGTTGEKTGLWRYWNDGGAYPVVYLKMQHKARGLENLVTAGLTRLIAEEINRWHGFGVTRTLEALREIGIDTQKCKPHEMLGLTRGEMRLLHGARDPARLLELWRDYLAAGGKEDTRRLWELAKTEDTAYVCTLIGQIGVYGGDLGKYTVWLGNHGDGLRDIGLLRDCRSMALRLAPGRKLTSEELWPRDLHAAHERLTAQVTALEDEKLDAEYGEGFARVHDKFAPIEWSDGTLAVKLPISPCDLRREGEVLRHCVGGYCGTHAAGKSIILFVRHARRPERSYYTLNMRFEKSEPQRIQLHGYGNERHGDRKQYRHSIPAAVTAFVDRWEKEIAAPWWRAEQNRQRKEKTA